MSAPAKKLLAGPGMVGSFAIDSRCSRLAGGILPTTYLSPAKQKKKRIDNLLPKAHVIIGNAYDATAPGIYVGR